MRHSSPLLALLAVAGLVACGDPSSSSTAQHEVANASTSAPASTVTPVASPAADASTDQEPAWQCTRQWSITHDDQCVQGADACSGPDDCSGQVELRVDPTGVTCVVIVTDDRLQIDADDQPIHSNDSVEVYLDIRSRRDRIRSDYEAGVFQFMTCPGLGERPDRFAFHGGASKLAVAVAGTTSTSERLEHGYRVTIFFPAAGLQRQIGDDLAFSVGINDADGHLRESQLMLAGTVDNWQLTVDWQVVDLSSATGG